MSTRTFPAPIPLHRPWWARWAEGWQTLREWMTTPRVVQHCLACFGLWDGRVAAQLDDRTLKDIGAPDWLREEAAARRRGDAFSEAWQSPSMETEMVSRW